MDREDNYTPDQEEAPQVEIPRFHRTPEALEINQELKVPQAFIDEIQTFGNIDLDKRTDYKGTPIPCNFVIRTRNTAKAAETCAKYGMYVLMIGAKTSETGNFTINNPGIRPTSIIGIEPEIAAKPTLKIGKYETPLNSTEVILDPETMEISAGVGLTPSQINELLAEHFGHDGYEIEADLTTKHVAVLGGIYNTGAQGPSRRKTSDMLSRVAIYDGTQIKQITDPEEIAQHEGLFGLTGATIDMTFRLEKKPPHKFGTLIFLNDEDEDQKLATIVAALQAGTQKEWDYEQIRGIEYMSLDGAKLILEENTDPDAKEAKHARALDRLFSNAKARGALYIMGYSKGKDIDEIVSDKSKLFEILMNLAEKGVISDEIVPITGKDPLDKMDETREAFPDSAKRYAKGIFKGPDKGKFLFATDSTDINARINPEIAKTLTPDQLQAFFHQIIAPYIDYKQGLSELAETAQAQEVKLRHLDYGHYNPRDINPHTRFIIESARENEGAHFEVLAAAKKLRDRLFAALEETKESNPAIEVTVGEKGRVTADALRLSTPNQIDEIVETLAAAAPMFQAHIKGKIEQLVNERRQTAIMAA